MKQAMKLDEEEQKEVDALCGAETIDATPDEAGHIAALLSSGDIVAAFNSVGKSVSDGEAQGMLSEAPGPVNFTQMVMLFAEKMAGGADDDDTILKAFDAFEVNGKIDADMFKHSLMTFGDKFTSAEVDNAFGEFSIEDGMIDAVQLKGLMVSKKEEGEEA